MCNLYYTSASARALHWPPPPPPPLCGAVLALQKCIHRSNVADKYTHTRADSMCNCECLMQTVLLRGFGEHCAAATVRFKFNNVSVSCSHNVCALAGWLAPILMGKISAIAALAHARRHAVKRNYYFRVVVTGGCVSVTSVRFHLADSVHVSRLVI